jgi:hypothetical protein
MKRYKLQRDMEAETDCWCEMDEDAKGDYVLYADYIAEIAKYQAAVSKQEKRIEAIKGEMVMWQNRYNQLINAMPYNKN